MVLRIHQMFAIVIIEAYMHKVCAGRHTASVTHAHKKRMWSVMIFCALGVHFLQCAVVSLSTSTYNSWPGDMARYGFAAQLAGKSGPTAMINVN